MADGLELVRLRLAAGAEVRDLAALGERGRRAVALARRVGAPLEPVLAATAEAEADARRAARAVQVASAQARAVAAALLVAPWLLVPALGALLGLDLAAFYARPLGLGVLVVAVALVSAGAGLVLVLLRRVRRATTAPVTPPSAWALAAGAGVAVGWALAWPAGLAVGLLVLRRRQRPGPPAGVDEAADLAATALTGGVDVATALRLAGEQRTDLRAGLARLALGLQLHGPRPAGGDEPAWWGRLADVVAVADEVGAPAAAALRRLAAELRQEELARALSAAERLPAQLTLPTALCLLPAVLLAVGAPLVDAGLRSAITA